MCLAPLSAIGAAADELSPRNLVGETQANASTLVYGIGDVHGMNDLPGRLLDAIEADARAHDMPATVIFLGDVVNRGGQTRQVIDRLLSGLTRPGDDWIALRGNHEQMMLDALTVANLGTFERWLKMGGIQTLASYGCPQKKTSPNRAFDFVDPSHIRFLEELPMMHIVGTYLFVDSRVQLGIPLQSQDVKKLLTIRGHFLRKPHRLPFTVIHGHTPTDGQPRHGPARIGIDTGAYFTGLLTAIAIEPNRQHPAVHQRYRPRYHGVRRVRRMLSRSPSARAATLSMMAPESSRAMSTACHRVLE